MQQDPSSSWNKPLLYRNKSAATTSTTTAATATTPTVSSTAAAAVVVAVATNSTATSTGSTSGSSALPPSIHSRSPASTPCLTSSHVRPNTNRHADVLAIHPSFDLSIPSSSDSGHSLSSPPSSPTSSSDHQDSINAIVAYQHEHETTLQNDTTSPSSQGKRSADWLPYNTTVTVSLRELRDLGTESRSSLDHDLESDNDVEMRQDAPTSKNNKSNDDNNRSSNNSTVKQIQDY
ncbi:hypothetical protein BCR41DRAFT_211540 [Lobosporangium transversale]|uniref:Uncharacterized protein n=1 Tax=Lobosporangium transversale TaxID=64571 RepID=A0A1Y2G7F3_9FUNG|nr:hypothetical protein BCR41DRAFT_211540 [Lobosporangium transversale]ORZ00009.1 hypothetical protein BCR41DRAFT_211540 [Lobosporangium transversale]|eukprot:XP_021876050.1 hypothetical protein BCR41DRAFT_211540 [Lobosporangium transversale]